MFLHLLHTQLTCVFLATVRVSGELATTQVVCLKNTEYPVVCRKGVVCRTVIQIWVTYDMCFSYRILICSVHACTRWYYGILHLIRTTGVCGAQYFRKRGCLRDTFLSLCNTISKVKERLYHCSSTSQS